MSSINSISCEKLARLIGTPKCPALIDVSLEADFAADPFLVPGAKRQAFETTLEWAQAYAGRSCIVICQKGLKISQGVAALLRHSGINAEVLDGGSQAWRALNLPRAPVAKLPAQDALGRTVWVTRERPKIDRIACPWLIRRFIDPSAVFLFVETSQVQAVAERFGAAPFDIEDTFWSHRGELCTFDVMIEEWGLGTDALKRLASIVRAADTGRLDLAPEAPGLLAASLGLSRMYSHDGE